MIPTTVIKEGLKIAFKIVLKETAKELAKKGMDDLTGNNKKRQENSEISIMSTPLLKKKVTNRININ